MRNRLKPLKKPKPLRAQILKEERIWAQSELVTLDIARTKTRWWQLPARLIIAQETKRWRAHLARINAHEAAHSRDDPNDLLAAAPPFLAVPPFYVLRRSSSWRLYGDGWPINNRRYPSEEAAKAVLAALTEVLEAQQVPAAKSTGGRRLHVA